MSANVDAMVREGINAYKSGQKDEARSLLLKATELDPYSEQAWLWLSGLMDTPDDQRTCLENVLAINPNNERAKQGLSYLTGQTSAGNVSPFAASATPPPAYPSDSPPSAYATAASSVDWGMADDTPSSPPQPAWSTPAAEPVGEALDDWVNNLNLPVNDMSESSVAALSATSPFGDFDLDDDLLGDGPFGAAPLSLDDDEDEAPPARPASSRRSPVPTNDMLNFEPEPAPRRNRKARGNNSNSLLADADRDGDSAYFEEGEGEMFGFIPPEIPVTRLPGTNERTPILLIIGMVVLVLVNVGLAVVIMLNIFT